jgi:hypothetical protein
MLMQEREIQLLEWAVKMMKYDRCLINTAKRREGESGTNEIKERQNGRDESTK